MSIPAGNNLIYRVGVDGVQESQAKLSQFSGSFKDVATTIGLTTLAITALTATYKLFSNSAAKAREQFEAERMVESRIKSTGNAAEVSAWQLRQWAAELQKTTNYGDEAVLSLSKLLLTFTKIKGPIFKEAQQTIIDMATVMGTDLQSAAIQVGKALQDPTIGLTALRRSGVNFNKTQQDVIKNLFETGRVAEAQRMILHELNVEFGGAAESIARPSKMMANAMGDWMENIGAKMLPTLDKFSIKMKNLFVSMTPTISSIEEATRAAANERMQFETLIGTYESLHKVRNKTLLQQESYKKVVNEIVSKYGNYLSQQTLEKGNWDDIQKAIGKARDNLDQYLQFQMLQVMVRDKMDEMTDALKKGYEAETRLAELRKNVSGMPQTYKTVTESGYPTTEELPWVTMQRLAAQTVLNINNEMVNQLKKDIDDYNDYLLKKFQNVITPVTKVDLTNLDGEGAGASKDDIKKQLSSILTQLHDFHNKRYAMSLSGKDKELALVELEYEDRKAIITASIQNEEQRKAALVMLAEQYNSQIYDIAKEYADKEKAMRDDLFAKEVAAAEKRFQDIIAIQRRFDNEMRGIDSDYYKSFRLRMLQEDIEAYKDAGVNELLLDKWVSEQKKEIDRDYRRSQQQMLAQMIDDWKETHAIQAAIFDGIGRTFEDTMNRMTRITTSKKNDLVKLFVELANNIIAELNRIIAKQIVVFFWSRLLGMMSGPSGAMFGGSGVDYIPTGDIASYSGSPYVPSLSPDQGTTIKSVTEKLDRLISAIEDNPPQIYTQLIEGVPLANAVQRANARMNNL